MAQGRVLVIDDDDEIRWSIRFVLETEGYEVFEAPDALVGRDLLRVSGQLLVVLVDYMMPRLNGLQLLREVADDGYTMQRHAYILLTAAYDLLPSGTGALLTSLSVPLLKKPFDLDVLLECVAQANARLGRSTSNGGSRPQR